MIAPAYVQTMAAYNAEMNRRLYEAAGRLSGPERRADRGAFWRSIHGTLNHLLWGDRAWMARLAGWEKPVQALAESDRLYDDFSHLSDARVRADAGLSEWAAGLDASALAGSLTWYSGAAGREMARPRGFLVIHLFNHQTHHRGQVHAMLTASGERPGDTDLPLVLPPDAEQRQP